MLTGFRHVCIVLSASLGLIEGTGLTDEVNQYEGVSQRYVGKQIVSSL